MANTDANSQSMSNNHISSQPCTSQTEVEGKGSSDTPLDHDVVFEETREVLKRFLVKHLSREAINVTPDSQYEGYHQVKADRSLPVYHRQRSKPERDSEKRHWTGRRKSADPSTSGHVRGGWPVQNSHPSLKTETEYDVRSADLSGEEQSKYQSEMDVHTIQRLAEMANNDPKAENNQSIMFRLLRSQENLPNSSRSRNFMLSAGEDGLNHARRESFNQALTRKSVLSFIEKQSKISVKGGANKLDDTTHTQQSSISEHHVLHEEDEEENHQRQDSGLHDGGGVVAHPPHVPEVHLLKEENRHKNRNLSFRERMKKIMPNKKKIKFKKPDGPMKTDDSLPWDDKSRDEETRIRSADARMTYSIDSAFKKATENKSHYASGSITGSLGHDTAKHFFSKHKNGPFHERTPSPTKAKTPLGSPKFLRALTHKRLSPKVKRRPFHESSSSASLSLMGGQPVVRSGELQRDKSGSLPLSMRYGVDQQLSKKNQRRLSESLFPVNASEKKSKRSASPDKPAPVFHASKDHFPDGKEKKHKPIGKIRRFIRMFRKRHASESSTASSKGSHSLPSIPAAIDQEQNDFAMCGSPNTSVLRPLAGKDEDDQLVVDGDEVPYHHRGSLSFSSGDLDGLSGPEKQKIYDEIAETLSRLSSKYTRHIRSRSGPHVTTGKAEKFDGTFSSQDLNENLSNRKLPASSPPSRQTSTISSKSPAHSPGKGFRKCEKNENSPAMTAYLNLSNQTRTKEARPNKMDAVMPKTASPRGRRIHHTKTGSLDSPHPRQPRTSVPDIRIQAPSVAHDAPDEDVTDGPPPAAEEEEVFKVVHRQFIEASTTETFLPDSVDGTSTTFVEYEYSSVAVNQVSAADILFGGSRSFTDENRRSRESRPSTSRAQDSDVQDDEVDMGDNPYTAPIDEDKLVQLLVDALCKKGDEYAKSVDMPNGVALAPIFRTLVLRYISGVTYSSFQNFAQRFCSRCRQLVETSPTRHPEVFPFVMVFSMTQLIVDLTRSEQAVSRIKDYTSRFISNLLEGNNNTWGTVLEQLQDTEEELSQEESTQDQTDSQRKDSPTDDELD